MVCKFNTYKINETLQFGDCRHKHFLLKKLLETQGFKVRTIIVLFDWKDLPIPNTILNILSETKFKHYSLEVKLNNV